LTKTASAHPKASLSLLGECKVYVVVTGFTSDSPIQINNVILKVHYENEFPNSL